MHTSVPVEPPLFAAEGPRDEGAPTPGPSPALLAGLRERHFGTRLRGVAGVARFLDAFELDGSFWLVFRDEGVSLHNLLYTTSVEPEPRDGAGGEAEAGEGPGERPHNERPADEAEASVTMRPSAAWLHMRQHPLLLRYIVRQTMQGIAALHSRKITHRDIKPANVIVDLNGLSDGAGRANGAGRAGRAGDAERGGVPVVRLADFGSAVDSETLQRRHGLYPASGPTVQEETEDYQPPEARLSGVPYDAADPASYDLWSAGISILELLLGTPRVLQLSARAGALLRLRFADQPPPVLRRLLEANALAEHCILPPTADAFPAHFAHAGAAEAEAAVGGGGGGGGNGAGGDGGDDGLAAAAGPSSPLSAPSVQLGGCGKAEFIAAIRRADPLAQLGIPLDEGLLDLAWRLLRWLPSERLPAAEALLHPALLGPPPSFRPDGDEAGDEGGDEGGGGGSPRGAEASWAGLDSRAAAELHRLHEPCSAVSSTATPRPKPCAARYQALALQLAAPTDAPADGAEARPGAADDSAVALSGEAWAGHAGAASDGERARPPQEAGDSVWLVGLDAGRAWLEWGLGLAAAAPERAA